MTTASTLRQRWLTGHGPIVHRDETAARVEALVARLIADGRVADEATAYTLLAAADRLGCVAMNVVAHMTYARRIDLSGAALSAECPSSDHLAQFGSWISGVSASSLG